MGACGSLDGIKLRHPRHKGEEGQVILLPEGFTFGLDVERLITREGDVVTITPNPRPADAAAPESE